MKKLIVVAAIASLAVVGWKMRSHKTVDAQDGRNVLVDRIWIDHLPAHERDPINFLALLSDEKIGVMQNTTAFRGSYEMFKWGNGGWRWPQTGETDKPTIRVRTCNENGMDYCMDISGVSRGVKHYASRKDWVIKSIADEQALAAKLDAAR
jgi:hypothetical protein